MHNEILSDLIIKNIYSISTIYTEKTEVQREKTDRIGHW